VLPSQFKAVQRWDAAKCSGFLVALAAVDEAMALADEFGVGIVTVDNAFHYLWFGIHNTLLRHSRSCTFETLITPPLPNKSQG
jgi:LDH2 family malate/lactate/ureidoglycolate dehydrogenase